MNDTIDEFDEPELTPEQVAELMPKLVDLLTKPTVFDPQAHFKVEGALGGDIELAPFTTATNQPRVDVRILSDRLGQIRPPITLDERGIFALITSLVGALGDARVMAALNDLRRDQ